MTSESCVSIDIQPNGCATISLNRPDVRNALNGDLIVQLTTAISDCDKNPFVRVIVLTGQGEIFCAGADLAHMKKMAEFTYDENVSDALRLGQLFETLDTCNKPTVAIVQGGAYGGGVGLVAASDIVIASDTAKFALTEVRLGIVPAVISPYIINAIGQRNARHYALTARALSSDEALAVGLIQYRESDEKLEETAQQVIHQLLKGSSAAQAATKKLFRDVNSRPITHELINLTAKAIADARASQDGQEGLQAFLEKRQPNWITPHDKN